VVVLSLVKRAKYEKQDYGNMMPALAEIFGVSWLGCISSDAIEASALFRKENWITT
jgi:hypothetical protein